MSFNKVLNCFINTEYFRETNLVTKHLYLAHTLTGGIYYEDYVRRWFRYFVCAHFAIACSVGPVSSIVALRQETLSLHDGVTFTIVAHFIHVSLTIGLVTAQYIEREPIKRAIQAIGEHFNEPVKPIPCQQPIGTNDRDIDYTKYLKYWYYTAFLTLLVSYTGKIVMILLTKETSTPINAVTDFVFPFPFVASISVSQYILISCCLVFCEIPAFLTCCGSVTLDLMILFHLKNQFTLLGREIEIQSNSTLQIIEQSYDHELAIIQRKFMSPEDKKARLLQISKEREQSYREFADRTKEWIYRHQKIYRAMNHAKYHVRYSLSVYLVFGMAMVIAFIHAASSMPATHNDGSGIYYIYGVTMLGGLLVDCFVAHVFKYMMEDFAAQVYNMPWYALPPKQRKDILIFLTLAQRTQEIRAFNMFPLSLEKFSSILSNLHSYNQALNLVKNKAR